LRIIAAVLFLASTAAKRLMWRTFLFLNEHIVVVFVGSTRVDAIVFRISSLKYVRATISPVAIAAAIAWTAFPVYVKSMLCFMYDFAVFIAIYFINTDNVCC
jgi:hypothetical protein